MYSSLVLILVLSASASLVAGANRVNFCIKNCAAATIHVLINGEWEELIGGCGATSTLNLHGAYPGGDVPIQYKTLKNLLLTWEDMKPGLTLTSDLAAQTSGKSLRVIGNLIDGLKVETTEEKCVNDDDSGSNEDN